MSENKCGTKTSWNFFQGRPKRLFLATFQSLIWAVTLKYSGTMKKNHWVFAHSFIFDFPHMYRCQEKWRRIWLMIICKRPVPPDNHLQEAGPSGWPSARGRSLGIIICKRPAPPDDYLQEAGPSGSSFARGRPLQMTICKRPVPPDHHLQEAGPSGWPSARGLSLWIIICKRPAPHFDNHEKGMKSAFLRPFTIR